MRFLADMGISPATVAFLREEGYEADHIFDRGDPQRTDRDILEIARSESRTLLFHDLDFTDLVAGGGEDLPSVVLFRLRNMRPGHVNRRLEAILDRHEEILEEGAIFSVSEAQIRWRALPFDRESASESGGA